MAVTDQLHARKRRNALELLNNNKLGKARKAFQELLEQDQSDAESWMMLGIVAGRSDKPQAAEQCMQYALKAEPEYAEAWFSYGQVLQRQRREEDAMKAYQQAIAFNPRLAEARAALGLIFLQRGWFRHAVSHLREALDIGVFRKELMVAYGFAKTGLMIAYGDALRFSGSQREAMDIYRTVLEQTPEDSELLQRIGSLHIDLSQFDEARRILSQMKAIAPDNTRLTLIEVKLLSLEQRFDEALARIRPLFDSNPDDILIAMTFARLCHISGECADAIGRLESLVQGETTIIREKAAAYFELGRLYDRAGDYDRAFAWYRNGNELKKTEYNCLTADAETDAIIAGYSRENLAAASRARNNDARLVFIVGMPRSGSSLIEQILASHPQVYGAGELGGIADLLREHRESLIGMEHERLKNECLSFTPEVLDELAGRYLEQIESVAGTSRYVTDKMLNNFFRLGAIALMFPKARIIHCRRNPIDTCLSCYLHHFTGFLPFTYDFESLANYYRNYRRLMAHWKQVIDLPMLEVDYESLVDSQEAETRRLLNFLDLDWHDNCLSYHKNSRPTVTASYDQVNKPIYKSSVARWKHYEKHVAPLIELLQGSPAD